MDRNPATSASAVPPTPSPPTSPATTPIAKNSAAISLNPQPNRSTPTTSAPNATSTRVRTAPGRRSSVPAVGSGAVVGAARDRPAARDSPRRQAARSRTAASGGGGISPPRAEPPDLVRLVHVRAAGRLEGDSHQGPCCGLGLDRSVPGQRPHERPGDERAEQPGHALRGPALGPRADG